MNARLFCDNVDVLRTVDMLKEIRANRCLNDLVSDPSIVFN